MALTAIALNCTLKSSDGESSSTDKMIGLLVSELKKLGVGFDGTIRVADFNVKPGVTSDEGEGDDWPELRRRILAADILIFGTPIWLGQPSSIAKRVTERMDAFLSETDDKGRMPSYGKVAVVAVVGNEDGAHKVIADCFQGLNDIGYSIPAQGGTYWTGEAMESTDFKDLDEVPEAVASTNAALARNAAHLANVLRDDRYPPYQ